MFGKLSKKLWFAVALSILTIFCFILTAHSVIPHEHAHDFASNGLLSSLHSGVSEDKHAVVLLVGLVLFIRLTPRVLPLVSQSCMRFCAQGPEVRALLPLLAAYAAGLLNPRPY